MNRSLKITKILTLIVFSLLFYFSGQLVQSPSKQTNKSQYQLSDDTNLTYDTASEISIIAEENMEASEKDCPLFHYSVYNRKTDFNQICILKKYTNNIISPEVILISQTNLPPPETTFA